MTHRAIRQKMYQEAYTNMNNEQTTVRFVVIGLKGNQLYKAAAWAIRIRGLATSVYKLQERLLEEEKFATTIPQPPVLQTQTKPPARGKPTHRGGGHWRGHGSGAPHWKTELKTEVAKFIQNKMAAALGRKPSQVNKSEKAERNWKVRHSMSMVCSS